MPNCSIKAVETFEDLGCLLSKSGSPGLQPLEVDNPLLVEEDSHPRVHVPLQCLLDGSYLAFVMLSRKRAKLTPHVQR